MAKIRGVPRYEEITLETDFVCFLRALATS